MTEREIVTVSEDVCCHLHALKMHRTHGTHAEPRAESRLKPRQHIIDTRPKIVIRSPKLLMNMSYC